MTDINKKFKMIIENEDLFKSNPEVMLRLKYLVDNKKSLKTLPKEEIDLYIYLNRHNITNHNMENSNILFIDRFISN